MYYIKQHIWNYLTISSGPVQINSLTILTLNFAAGQVDSNKRLITGWES